MTLIVRLVFQNFLFFFLLFLLFLQILIFLSRFIKYVLSLILLFLRMKFIIVIIIILLKIKYFQKIYHFNYPIFNYQQLPYSLIHLIVFKIFLIFHLQSLQSILQKLNFLILHTLQPHFLSPIFFHQVGRIYYLLNKVLNHQLLLYLLVLQSNNLNLKRM